MQQSVLESQGLIGLKINCRILTQNCWMMPLRRSRRGACRSARVDAFGNWLEDQEIALGLDIVLLQDLWRGNDSPSCLECLCGGGETQTIDIQTTLLSIFPHITKFDSRGSRFSGDDLTDSGLSIASKHPIIAEMFLPYPTKSDTDSISTKGVLVAAVCLPNK